MAKTWATGDQVNAADLNLMVVPAGAVLPYAGNSIPSNWLLCDGSAVSRTTYADLFAAIGTLYGAGDGSTTFNLPDTTAQVIAGYKAADTNFGTLGAKVGEATHLLTVNEIPPHTHDIGNTNGASGVDSQPQSSNQSYGPQKTTHSTGGGTAHNNVQPSITMRFIIRY